MKKKTVSGVMLTPLLIGMLTLVFNIQLVRAPGTIYIRADGSVDPVTANISSVDNVTYTFTGNNYDSIVLERDNIVVDGAGYVLQGTGSATGIDLCGRNNVTIKNMEIKAFGLAIYLFGSSSNSIAGNNITRNNRGVSLYQSSDNTVSGNNIAKNNDNGVSLFSSSSNSIAGNNITRHSYGVSLYISLYNTVSGNNITNNSFGVKSQQATDSITENIIANNYYGVSVYSWYNKVYHNSFIDNTYQVYVIPLGYTNFWDDGYPSGGNYWSDHVTVDECCGVNQDEPGSDGIVDEPYVIDYRNRDNYPLVEPWRPSPQEDLEELIETIKSWNLPVGTENSLTSKLEEAILLLNKGNENGAIHKLMDFIMQVEALRDMQLTNEQADYLIAEAQRIINLI